MTEPLKLGKYDLLRQLGQGAMGVVYEGFDPAIGRRVALKTVRNDQFERAEMDALLIRFRREAQAAGRLDHPNIVATYQYGEEGGTAYIAMEFVEGRELKDYLDAGERFTMAETVRLMGQLLDALDYSHRNGVVHRDIKPANIIILKDGTVKVADFGIARIESSNLTLAGTVLGTPSYMSPEQFKGQIADGRSDLYSAGIILYQFLTGEKPFSGTFTTIMHKVLKEEPPAPSSLNARLTPPFDALIGKALAKHPQERFQSGREFMTALRIAAAGQALTCDYDTFTSSDFDSARVRRAEDTPVVEKTLVLAKSAPLPSPDSRSLRAKAPHSKPWPTIVIVSAIIGLGVVAYLLY